MSQGTEPRTDNSSLDVSSGQNDNGDKRRDDNGNICPDKTICKKNSYDEKFPRLVEANYCNHYSVMPFHIMMYRFVLLLEYFLLRFLFLI